MRSEEGLDKERRGEARGNRVKRRGGEEHTFAKDNFFPLRIVLRLD
jgi:hypothetical protein